jgi:hypothetical protein
MRSFLVKVVKKKRTVTYTASGISSGQVAEQAAKRHGVCGITVVPHA